MSLFQKYKTFSFFVGHKNIIFTCAALCVCLGTAFAQDIYVRPTDGRGNPLSSGGAIYVKPMAKVTSSQARDSQSQWQAQRDVQQRNSYKEKLKLAMDKKDVQARVDIYNEWRASGVKPKTVEEIVVFAQASRASNEAYMLKRREALISYLDRKRSQEAIARVQQASLEKRLGGYENMRFDFDAPQGNSKVSNEADAEATRTIIQKPQIYVVPDDYEPAKGPKRIFNVR